MKYEHITRYSIPQYVSSVVQIKFNFNSSMDKQSHAQ